MATTRTLRASRPGPITVKANLPGCDLKVTADPKCEYGEITISTRADTGPAAERVNKAILNENERGNLTISLARGTGGPTMVVSGGGSVQINRFGGVMVGGSVITSDGDIHVSGGARNVYVNGKLVTGGDTGGDPFAPVTITARVPVASTVEFTSTGGDLHTVGALNHVDADTTGGNVCVDTTDTADVYSTGGNVDVGFVRSRATLRTTGGNITVNGADGARVKARTTGGNINHAAVLDCNARSTGGRVRTF